MKSARIGEMHTKITVKSLATGMDTDGYPTEAWTDVFGGKKVWCNWKNAHGEEVYEAMRLDLKEPATITMRYSDKVNTRCRIWHEVDSLAIAKETDLVKRAELETKTAYEIISIETWAMSGSGLKSR
jgi:SPP1 family predicted phage head-tail adaptor